MKFLIDNALSPFISESLKKLGYDSAHVREIGLRDAADEAIFQKAKQEKRMIISADTDFGYLLSNGKEINPLSFFLEKG